MYNSYIKLYSYIYVICEAITILTMIFAIGKFPITMSIVYSVIFIILVWISRRRRVTPVEMRDAIQARRMAKFLPSACSADVLSDGCPSVHVGRAANLPRPDTWISPAFRFVTDRDPICLTCRRSPLGSETIRNIVHILVTKRSPPSTTETAINSVNTYARTPPVTDSPRTATNGAGRPGAGWGSMRSGTGWPRAGPPVGGRARTGSVERVRWHAPVSGAFRRLLRAFPLQGFPPRPNGAEKRRLSPFGRDASAPRRARSPRRWRR